MVATGDDNPAAWDPDVQLMLRVKEGDEDAFVELTQACQSQLVSFFCKLG